MVAGNDAAKSRIKKNPAIAANKALDLSVGHGRSLGKIFKCKMGRRDF